MGRVRKLPVAYRSTKEGVVGGSNPPVVEVVPGDMAGRYLVENICNDIKAGLAYSDIGMLCAHRYQTEKFHECLARHKIPAYWLVKDAESKKNYDAGKDRVLISTVHSAKGLEFEKVYFMNLEVFPLDYLNERENASMVYVAMTRAKKQLTIVSGSRTPTFARISETVVKYCADCG